MFAHGISKEGDLIDLGVAMGIIKKNGAFFSYGETRIGQGRENSRDYLCQNKELALEIESQIRATASTQKDILPQEPESTE